MAQDARSVAANRERRALLGRSLASLWRQLRSSSGPLGIQQLAREASAGNAAGEESGS